MYTIFRKPVAGNGRLQVVGHRVEVYMLEYMILPLILWTELSSQMNSEPVSLGYQFVRPRHVSLPDMIESLV